MSDAWAIEVFREAWDLGIPDSMLQQRFRSRTPGEIRLATQGRVGKGLFRLRDIGKSCFLVSENRDGAPVYHYRLAARRNTKAWERRAVLTAADAV